MTPQTIRAAITDLRQEEHRTYPLTGSKASGATRRASLDLTRALAEMRKP